MLFQGICNPPDEILEATFRITATNRMNLQRLLTAAGADSATLPVGISGERRQRTGGGGRRREREVLALLPVRLLGGRIWRSGDL